MPSTPLTPKQALGRVAIHQRWHGPDAPQTIDARRQLAEANVAAYIEKQLAAAPPFEPEQIERLTALLRTGAPAGTGGAVA